MAYGVAAPACIRHGLWRRCSGVLLWAWLTEQCSGMPSWRCKGSGLWYLQINKDEEDRKRLCLGWLLRNLSSWCVGASALLLFFSSSPCASQPSPLLCLFFLSAVPRLCCSASYASPAPLCLACPLIYMVLMLETTPNQHLMSNIK